MSTIDLTLLGALCQQPMSAYELQKLVEKRNLARWVKMKSATVYKKVATFEKKGYVSAQSVPATKIPEKTEYTITEKGREAFDTLMRDFSESPARIFLDLNAVLVNLPLISEETAREYIANIHESIRITKEQIAAQINAGHEASFLRDTLLKQQSMLLETLATWEEDFEREYFSASMTAPAKADDTETEDEK